MNSQQLYTQITDQILKLMQEHGSDWSKPWSSVSTGIPENYVTGNPYHGINTLMLMLATSEKDYQSNQWATFKQWKFIGGSVRSGEKGIPCIYYKPVEIEKNGDKKVIPMIKNFHVFNIDQVDGVDAKPVDAPFPANMRDMRMTKFISNTGAVIQEGGDSACYVPSKDIIKMPALAQFESSDLYYQNLLHELSHWTGHQSRLNRYQAMKASFGSEEYAAEELVAELSAAFLSVQLGVTHEPQDHTAKYLNNWIRVLEKDNRAFVKAAGLAQKAADYLMESSPLVIAA